MTDIAYRCHDCGSVHEVASIRENLLDLRAVASYELSGRRGMIDARERFRRWRMTQGIIRALWPGYPESAAPRLESSSPAPGSLRVFPPNSLGQRPDT
jgi:hypothetical protein